MAEDGTDILMKVVQGGSALATGAAIDVTSGDTQLLGGFQSGRCCFLTSFGLSAGGSGQVAASHDQTQDQAQAHGQQTGAATGKGSGTDPHAAQAAAAKRSVAPGEPQPLTFKRRADGFSPLLLSTLVAGKGLDSLTVVKRKAGGGGVSGSAYLRLDFTNVLLVALDWSDDEEGVEEEGRFVYLGLSVSYRPQMPSGGLGVAVNGSFPRSSVGGAAGRSGRTP